MHSSIRHCDRAGAAPRRDFLKMAMMGGVAATGIASSLNRAWATAPKKGGTLIAGCAGGGAKDTVDAHQPVSYPDNARVSALYEGLATLAPDYSVQLVLAEEIQPNATADAWTVKLRKGVTFHSGRALTSDDVIFSLRRITDPKAPGAGASSISDIDRDNIKKIDDYTVAIPLNRPNVQLDRGLAQYYNGIVPVGYDPKTPVGTGPFRLDRFVPGDRSHMSAYAGYWRTGLPYLGELVIIDFPDDTARINALLSGQVHLIDNVPFTQARVLGVTPGINTLVSKTGAWLPFTMRMDQAPFDDVRVRQAMRLIVDRPQMIEQALAGQGSIANDIYSPFDPAYDHSLPQRHQDLDQAKSLLKAAGHSNLQVELVTSGVSAGLVEAAQVFAQQAQGAGVAVNLRKVDSSTFFGSDYLKWTFAQDFWYTRDYLSQAADCQMPGAPFNETHFKDPKFISLIEEARRTLDAGKRTELIRAAQAIDCNTGGYIIWGFRDQVDGYSKKIGGLRPSRTGAPFGNYGFAEMYFV